MDKYTEFRQKFIDSYIKWRIGIGSDMRSLAEAGICIEAILYATVIKLVEPEYQIQKFDEVAYAALLSLEYFNTPLKRGAKFGFKQCLFIFKNELSIQALSNELIAATEDVYALYNAYKHTELPASHPKVKEADEKLYYVLDWFFKRENKPDWNQKIFYPGLKAHIAEFTNIVAGETATKVEERIHKSQQIILEQIRLNAEKKFSSLKVKLDGLSEKMIEKISLRTEKAIKETEASINKNIEASIHKAKEKKKSYFIAELVFGKYRFPFLDENHLVFGINKMEFTDMAMINFPLQILNGEDKSMEDIEVIIEFKEDNFPPYVSEDSNLKIISPIPNKFRRKYTVDGKKRTLCYTIPFLHPQEAFCLNEPLFVPRSERFLLNQHQSLMDIFTGKGKKTSFMFPLTMNIAMKDKEAQNFQICIQLIEMTKEDHKIYVRDFMGTKLKSEGLLNPTLNEIKEDFRKTMYLGIALNKGKEKAYPIWKFPRPKFYKKYFETHPQDQGVWVLSLKDEYYN